MINVFKTIRSLPSTTVSSLSSPSRFGRQVTGVSFATASDKHKMDKKPENQNEKTGDVMSHSFGEGYATRSDEEGFGGTYGGNQTLQKDNEIHENHPDYDKTQGSEAKEKEKSRNQTQSHG
ncbi:late embryogenesis abundant protein [Arabis alpina]|uniref:Late embryogenesis abundant protein n=1 Tax=Arabis alpina TaxID=50452 RepID=A0A087GEQ9_ARAAL|nr:late embryogenesis abundant protein [Arabis alpina]